MKDDRLAALRRDLREVASKEKAKNLSWFFKTGPGEYGEGDVFIGVTVPEQRRISKRYRDVELGDVEVLIQSPVHEERLVALLILVDRFSRGSEAEQRRIFNLYRRQVRFVNNWDLVDSSAAQIVGRYLDGADKKPLREWARARSLWKRRIAIVATHHYIKQGEFDETLRIARLLLRDREDLIHKAVGWMLREVGNRDRAVEEGFLREHSSDMPRTMLRYAIERFPESLRKAYLQGRAGISILFGLDIFSNLSCCCLW